VTTRAMHPGSWPFAGALVRAVLRRVPGSEPAPIVTLDDLSPRQRRDLGLCDGRSHPPRDPLRD
jgi:hypothetical protein